MSIRRQKWSSSVCVFGSDESRAARRRRKATARSSKTRSFAGRTGWLERLETRDLLSAVTVDTLNDTDAVAAATSPDDSSGDVSLRSAIEYLDATGGGTIGFDSSLYAGGPATITLGGTELAITQAMTITGPGANLLTVSGNNQSRIFDVNDGNATPDITVEIDGLTLTNGNAPTASNNAQGGAVYNAENLTLSQDAITNSAARGAYVVGTGGSGYGGAVYTKGSLTTSDDTFSGNTAGGGYGSNAGGVGEGGAIYSTGPLTANDDTFSGNNLAQGGNGGSNGGAGEGGGIYGAASMIVAGNTFAGNTAQGGSGAVSGYTVGGGFGEGGGIYSASNLTSINNTLTGNVAQGGAGSYSIGGGGGGGGIYSGGTLTAVNNTIAGNSAQGGAGQYFSYGSVGGGIDSQATLNLANSLVADNTASNDADLKGTVSGDNGGNLLGAPAGYTLAQVLALGANHQPLLADNGGPTQTIALTAGSPAIGAAAPLATLSAAVTDATSDTQFSVSDPTFLAEGESLWVGQEIVTVQSVDTANKTITVDRAQDSTNLGANASGVALYLATDQRGDTRTTNDIGAVLGPTGPAPSASVVVTTSADVAWGSDPTSPDDVNGNGEVSLRSAIAYLDSIATGGTITFAPNVTGAITLNGDELLISAPMTIAGPGAGQLTISGNSQSRIFDVNASPAIDVKVAISGLTLTAGNATSGTGSSASPSGDGGAIYNVDDLTLSDDNINGNSAAGGNDLASGYGGGGGVLNDQGGTLTLVHDTIGGNSISGGSGGGVYNETGATLISTQDTISGNSFSNQGSSDGGGGVYNNGTWTSTSDTISQNHADDQIVGGGGGVYNDRSAKASLTGDTLSGNTALLTAPSSAPIYGAGIYNSGTLTSTGDLVSGGNAGRDGGGVYNSGTFNSTDDTISGNTAAAAGGGVYNDQEATFDSIGDNISGNLANGDSSAGDYGGDGGAGIYNNLAATMSLTNATIGGNIAANEGGGIYNSAGDQYGDAGGTLAFANVTISGNTAAVDGGGIYNELGGAGAPDGTLKLANSLVAGNILGAAASAGAQPDLEGPISAGQANQIGLPAGVTLSQVLATNSTGAPLLADNGGPTQTIALVPGSPAISAAGALTALDSNGIADATSATFGVNDTTFLAVGDALKVDSEIMIVTAISGTQITVTRGQDGTAATHAGGASLFLAFDQRDLPRNANSDIGAFETQAPTVNIHVQNSSQVYSGAADPVSADVVGLNSATIATSPANDITFAHYAGTLTAGQIAAATPLTSVPVNAGSYTVVANFTSDVTGYRDAVSAPADFTIAPATPTVGVTDAGGVYNGQPFAATATVAGVVVGVDTTPAASLEDVTPSLKYYAGATATGTALSGAPSAAGTYTVLASFPGSTDYTTASDHATFTIAQATPTVGVTDAGGVYNGQPFAATASVAGVVTGVDMTPAASLEGVTPSLTYYAGATASGTALSGAPSAAGTYTVAASFAGSADYTTASRDTTFTIAPAAPTAGVIDADGVYNGQPFAATATVAGVVTGIDTTPTASLEGVTPSLTYYTGATTTGTALSGAPSAAGTYTVAASFPGSADYTTASDQATFTIAQATVTYQIQSDTQARGTPVNLAADLPGTLTVGYPAGVGYLAGVPGDGTAQTFVRNLYRELLGREADAAGLAYWTAQVQADDNMSGRESVIAQFVNSPEYKAHYITTLYEVFLDRAVDAAGLAFWTAKMGNPGTPGEHGGSADEQFILAAFVGSDEFYADAGGSNRSFVQTLYQDLLGRPGDAAGIASWTGLADAQPQNRDGIVRLFLGSPEAMHKLLDSFYPTQGGTAANPLPAPGTPVPDTAYDLALVTGLGWENLYLGGPYDQSPAGNDAFFTELANGLLWDDVQLNLLASDQFYTARG